MRRLALTNSGALENLSTGSLLADAAAWNGSPRTIDESKHARKRFGLSPYRPARLTD